MTTSPDLAPLQARLPDTIHLPTTPLLVEMLIVVYLVSVLAYATYGLRMYSRITSKQLGLEDWLMTAAMIFSIPLVSVQYFYYKYVFIGLRLSEIHPTDPNALMYSHLGAWFNQAFYSPILGLVKTSTLVFMLRIAGHMRNIKRAIHVINAINIALLISQSIATVFINIPVASYWDKNIQVEHRIDTAAFVTSTSTMTILTDFLVLAVPFWVFVQTQLPRATRCGVILVFMTGGLVTVIGIIRVCVFTQAFYEPEDLQFSCSWGPSLNTLETSLAILTANLPLLSPLLRKWFPRLFSNSRRGGSHQGRYYEQGGSGKERAVKLQDFSRQHPSTRSVSHSTTESQEGIFDPAGIMKTTDIHVAYSNRSIVGERSGETSQAGRSGQSDPALVV